MPSRSSYDADIIIWAEEQAALLRAGRFSELDISHLAEEIEDVGKSERRELASRLSVLLAHLEMALPARPTRIELAANHSRAAPRHRLAAQGNTQP